MSSAVFISDINTPLGLEITRLFLRHDRAVFGTVSTDDEKTSVPEALSLKDGDLLHVECWNRSSPISARNMLISAMNNFTDFDDFLLLGNPIPVTTGFHTVKVDAFQKEVDTWIKGDLFLLRDILSFCTDRQKGNLSLICLNHAHPEAPLEEMIRRGFTGLANSLLHAYGGKDLNIFAFDASSDVSEEFAAFIFRHLSERKDKASGRWLRFQKGIFSTRKPGVRPPGARHPDDASHGEQEEGQTADDQPREDTAEPGNPD